MNITIGITGASGSVLALKALEYLAYGGHTLNVVATENAKQVFEYETGLNFDAFIDNLKARLEHPNSVKLYGNRDMFAPIASGSVEVDAMLVLPCSMSSIAKIAAGVGDTLMLRAADVCIKERRRLVISPRETPLSPLHIRNMLILSELGVIIAPPMPQFYNRPKNIEELLDNCVGRILNSCGVKNELYGVWRSEI